MKKAVLGLGFSGVALVLVASGGGCSNEVQVQFGGAGGAQSSVVSVGDTQPVTNTAAHSTSVGITSNVAASTTTNVAVVGTSGVSNDASSNVAVNSSNNVGSVSTTNGVAVASVNVSSSSGMGLCATAPGDTACSQCAKTNCCAQYTTCFTQNGNCDCWAVCTQQNPNNPFACFQQCGQPDQAAIQLGQCTNQDCQAECGGAQPAGSSVASTNVSSGVGTSVASSSGSGGNPFACQPQFNDNACTTCTKNSCCSDVETCSTDQNCGCWVFCRRQGFSDAQCTQGCGAQNATTTELFACSATECPTACN